MNRNEVKTKYLYAIIACLVAVICLIPAVSAFFTDHAVLSAQIKTGTWNYSLAIDPKGGTWNGTTSATLMENLEAGQTVAIADPVRTGYTFTNWTLSAGSAGKFDSVKKIYTAAPGSKDTLSANWRANTYKIAFNGNGADGGSMPAQALTYDSKTALSVNAFTRTGYSFSGWNTSADGKGTTYADKTQVSNLSTKDGDTVQLYAQWSAITYHIAYDLNGGTAAGDNPATYTVESGAITLTAPMRTGYTFTGWTGANGTTPQTTVTIPSGSTGDRTYTANWKANTDTKYKVIHQQEQLDGSYKTVDTQNLTGTTDSKVTPAVKAYTGFTAPTAQTVTIDGAGTTTITYKYSRNSYTITRQYRLQNVGGGYANYQQIDSKSYKYGASIPAWNRAKDATYEAASIAAYTVEAKDRILSADVHRRTGRLVIDANGGIFSGSGSASRTTSAIRYGSTGDPILPLPTRTGYTLNGLYTAASGGTKVVNADGNKANDGTYSKNGAWQLNSDVPVYAQWTPYKYTVSFNANGGSGTTASVTATYGSALPSITNGMSRTGYTFAGFYDAATGGTQYYSASNAAVKAWDKAASTTLYAHWTANKYTVTLSKGQGIDSVSGAGTYTYGQTVTINATVNSNYNWSQWNVLSGTVSGTLTNQKLTFTMPAGNVSLRAGDAIGSDAHRKTYVITYHANLHDGQKLQDSDGTGSTDTHISSIPSGAVKGTSGGTEVYQQTILSGGGSKVLGNGFSWTAVKAAAAKVMSTLFDTNWDE